MLLIYVLIWDVIAEALSTKGVRVNIITNGYLFSEDIIKKLKAIQIESVSVSVDGPAEIHDKYQQPGSFERAERAVRILTPNGIPVSVISTINGENVAYLEAFYQQIKEWPVFAWQTHRFPWELWTISDILRTWRDFCEEISVAKPYFLDVGQG